jgi:hypothetical protein
MNWDALGAIAELLGAIAVVATLAYLSVQLRQNTASVRTSSAAAHSEAMRSLNIAVAQDAELVRLYWAGLANRAALTDEDRRRFDFLIGATTQGMEQMWRFHEEGVIDDGAWLGQQAALSWMAHEPGFIDYLDVYGGMLDPGFAAQLRKAAAEELSPDVAIAAEQSSFSDPSRRSPS